MPSIPAFPPDGGPKPSISRPRSVTWSVAPGATTRPLVPATRTPPMTPYGGKTAGRRPKQSTPVDIHVGSRLRQRRTELGISLPNLAASLGLTFQQLSKYEHAMNRISAGRLYEFS